MTMTMKINEATTLAELQTHLLTLGASLSMRRMSTGFTAVIASPTCIASGHAETLVEAVAEAVDALEEKIGALLLRRTERVS